jgi:hypothetical protein
MITGQQPQPFKRCPGTVRIFAARKRNTAPHRGPGQNGAAKKTSVTIWNLQKPTSSTPIHRRAKFR